MCLAVAMRIEQILPEQLAVAEMGGVRKTVSLALVDGVAEGDYVIVHVGFALARLDPDEARKTLALFAQIAKVVGTGGEGGP